MTPPPFIMIGALLFWGAHAGAITVALFMALVLELPRLVKRRRDFEEADFNRVADICAVIIVGLFVYFLSVTPFKALYVVGKWLPLAIFPIMAVQLYSTRGMTRVSALVWMLRRGEARGELTPRYVDLSFPYIAVCVIAAGAANVRTPWFYAGVILLTAWGLYPLRSKRYPVAVWFIALAIISVTGFGLHTGMNTFQKLTTGWYYKYFMKQTDPLIATTAIGDIGELKPSGRIAFRVKRAGAKSLPDLLSEGIYNIYSPPGWSAMGASLKVIQPGINNAGLVLISGVAKEAAVTVAAPLKQGEGVLKLPAETIDVTGLPVAAFRRNRLGAVTVEDGPGLVTYTARTGVPDGLDPPDRYDLKIPNQVAAAVQTVVHSLKLEGRPPGQVVDMVSDWFRNEFTYSLEQRDQGPGTALANFLLRSRSGHCEYFATATVLLLRASGIPSRYVTGYGLPEGTGVNADWVPVRDRDAHAWAVALIDGRWIPVDTTPPVWRQADNENVSIWEPLYNRLSDIYFAYALWRWGEDRNLSNYMLWLLIPMILYLGRNLFRHRKTRLEGAAGDQQPEAAAWPGADSPFYRVEQALLSKGYDRFEGETLVAWLSRIKSYLPDPELTDRIMGVLALHYRYRFDPLGLPVDARERLIRETDTILSGIGSRTS